MIFGGYLKLAVATFLTALLAATHWKAYHAGGVSAAVKKETAFALERAAWEASVSAARQKIEAQKEANRLAAGQADADNLTARAAINNKLKGAAREINRLSENLQSCRLSPELVRVLNDQSRAIDFGAAKD